ncbi:MAG: hypothetical protein KAR13_02065 [Desulfobulbaceae bacterium]|nr:hypothetical protein [Desulfobulbaceae bacterium]
MKKSMSIVAMVAMAVFFCANSSQAWIFQLDPGSAAGVHDINFIADGDTVTLDNYTLVFDYSGASGLPI